MTSFFFLCDIFFCAINIYRYCCIFYEWSRGLFYILHLPPANQRPVFGSREQNTTNQRPVFRLHGDCSIVGIFLQPIRDQYLGHVNNVQPIRGRYLGYMTITWLFYNRYLLWVMTSLFYNRYLLSTHKTRTHTNTHWLSQAHMHKLPFSLFLLLCPSILSTSLSLSISLSFSYTLTPTMSISLPLYLSRLISQHCPSSIRELTKLN